MLSRADRSFYERQACKLQPDTPLLACDFWCVMRCVLLSLQTGLAVTTQKALINLATVSISCGFPMIRHTTTPASPSPGSRKVGYPYHLPRPIPSKSTSRTRPFSVKIPQIRPPKTRFFPLMQLESLVNVPSDRFKGRGRRWSIVKRCAFRLRDVFCDDYKRIITDTAARA